MDRKLMLSARWAVFVAVSVYIAYALMAQDSRVWSGAFGSLVGMPLLLVVLLGWVNWGVEAFKWQVLLAPVQPVRYREALRATMIGTSVGSFTPNRTGEIVARAMLVKPGARRQAGVAAVLGSAAQFSTTLLAGLLSLSAWALLRPGQGILGIGGQVLLGTLLALGTVLSLFFFFNAPRVLRVVSRWPLVCRLLPDMDTGEGHNDRSRLRVLGLSLLRYALFAGQFVLLLSMSCGGGHWKIAALAVPMIYVVATVVPTMVLSELGVRGSAAVAILSPWGLSEPGILVACLALWLINIVLPAVIGAVLLVKRRSEGSLAVALA